MVNNTIKCNCHLGLNESSDFCLYQSQSYKYSSLLVELLGKSLIGKQGLIFLQNNIQYAFNMSFTFHSGLVKR